MQPEIKEINLSPDIVSALVLKKPGYEAIIEQIVLPKEGHPEEEIAFITSLFAAMAVEGDACVTNLRDAALTILADTQTQPILKSNPGFVLQTYIQSVRTQTWENDPYSGSIATLLEAGKVIASVLRPDKRDLNRIIKAWQKVSGDTPEAEDRKCIYKAVGEIKDTVAPKPPTVDLVKLDNQMEALSNQGLSCQQMAERLNVALSEINNSRARLLHAGRVGQMKKGRPKKTSELL